VSGNSWDLVLQRLQAQLDREEYRRWFTSTAYASDSGDQITVWVPTETDRRHLTRTYQDSIDKALETIGRPATRVRFVVSGFADEEADEDGEGDD
jgi:chromosomal replication initiation ATPase DnaA